MLENIIGPDKDFSHKSSVTYAWARLGFKRERRYAPNNEISDEQTDEWADWSQ